MQILYNGCHKIKMRQYNVQNLAYRLKISPKIFSSVVYSGTLLCQAEPVLSVTRNPLRETETRKLIANVFTIITLQTEARRGFTR